MQNDNEYIMALDLSLTNTGIAIFDNNENVVYIDNAPTDSKDCYPLRLKAIFDKIRELANQYSPSVIVIEKGFTRFHASTQALFRVQGVVMLAVYNYLQIFYSPSTIKKCVAGKGNASKSAVLQEVVKIYPDVDIKNTDQSDAIAVGITYFRKSKNGGEVWNGQYL